MATATMKKRRRVQIGKYKVVKHIATGGMGAIYRAVDVELDRPVALKILSPELAAKPVALERFRREARSAARLRHENIVSLYDIGEHRGVHFLALEFVHGIDLQKHLSRKGKLKVEEARNIILQTARALEHAHQQGIVHRDIKPANLLITKVDGKLKVKLTDLGLARFVREDDLRLTNPGTTMGTVDYMSPEQARDGNYADIRSDIYSLGCTFYHLLAGVAPFAQGSMAERLLQHLEAPPPDIRRSNPDVPEGVAAILLRMLAKKPDERYQTPAELIKDLENPEAVKVQASKNEVLARLAELARQEPEARAASRTVSRPQTPTISDRTSDTLDAAWAESVTCRNERPGQRLEPKKHRPKGEELAELAARVGNSGFLFDNWPRIAGVAAFALALLFILIQLFAR